MGFAAFLRSKRTRANALAAPRAFRVPSGFVPRWTRRIAGNRVRPALRVCGPTVGRRWQKGAAARRRGAGSPRGPRRSTPCLVHPCASLRFAPPRARPRGACTRKRTFMCEPAPPTSLPPPRRARVLLGATGSVAALKLPLLAGALRAAGADVRIAASERALAFFDAAALCADGFEVLTDHDEWGPWQKVRGDLSTPRRPRGAFEIVGW